MDGDGLAVPPVRVARVLNHVGIDDLLGNGGPVAPGERVHPIGQRTEEAPAAWRSRYVGMDRTRP